MHQKFRRPLNVAQRTTALMYTKKKMNDIMKIVKTLEKPGLLTKGISETVQNEVKKQN